MTLKTFRRMVEAFFRRWPIYVAILVAAIGYGVATISGTEDLYTSRGTVFVEKQSLVASQSGVATPAAFSYLTAAQTTSDQLRGLLQTDIFMASVVARAKADLVQGPSIEFEDPSPDSGSDDRDQFNLGTIVPPPDPVAWAAQATDIREAVNVYAVNENLMSVDATTTDPELSHALSIAIIEELIQFQITQDVAESAASEDFFLNLAGSYEQDVIETRQAVDDALRALSAADAEEVSDLEQREVDRLREAEVLAAARYRGALDEVELARLLSLQTQTDIQQSFSVFDPPRVPTEPDRSLVGELRILISTSAVGLALALILPIIVGLLQRTVLFPDDLDGVANVVSVVPKARRSTLRLTNVEPEPNEEMATEATRRVHHQATQTLTYDATELELAAVGSSPGNPRKPVRPPDEPRRSVAADELLAEIEGDRDDAGAAESTAPTEAAPDEAVGASADSGDLAAPTTRDPAPHPPATKGTRGSNGTDSPFIDRPEEPAASHGYGTQTETFEPIQARPVGPPGPPDRPRPPMPVGGWTSTDQPRPPGPPTLPHGKSNGMLDPTVTAEISSPPGEYSGPPPTTPGSAPPPPGHPGQAGFTVQDRQVDQTPSGRVATAKPMTDSGSEADETTETNHA